MKRYWFESTTYIYILQADSPNVCFLCTFVDPHKQTENNNKHTGTILQYEDAWKTVWLAVFSDMVIITPPPIIIILNNQCIHCIGRENQADIIIQAHNIIQILNKNIKLIIMKHRSAKSLGVCSNYVACMYYITDKLSKRCMFIITYLQYILHWCILNS